MRLDAGLADGEELGWRRNPGATLKNRVGEVQDQGSVNGVVAADKDQHVAGCRDPLVSALPTLLWRSQPHHLIGRRKRTLNLIDRGAHVVCDRYQTSAREVESSLLDRLGTCHLREQFRSVELVRRIGNPDVAVGNDTLFRPLFINDLPNVLRNEVRLQTVAGPVRQ